MPPSASRPAPPVVAPVEHAGVRYVQDTFYDSAGDQPGGYLAALDIKSGARLWRLKVYELEDRRAEGIPAMSRHFRSMALAGDGKALDIEDESGCVYRVDLAHRTSTFVSGPPAGPPAKPAAPPKPRP